MLLGDWLTGIHSHFGLTTSGRRRYRRKEPVAAQVSGQTLENRLLLTTYVNAGGPDLIGDPSFEAGQEYETANSRPLRRRHGIDTSGVSSDIPEALFQTNEISRRRGGNVSFAIPVSAGDEYQVDLLFSEIQAIRARPGARVFDVSLEGGIILDNFDIYSTAGLRTAVAHTTTYTAGDDTLNIDLTAVQDRPAIAGIVVTNLTNPDNGNGGGDDDGNGDGGGDQNSAPQISNVANQTINEGTSTSPIDFTVVDPDGDTISVSGTSNNPNLLPDTGILINPSGPGYTVQLTPNSDATGNATVTLTASDGSLSDTESFSLTVNATDDPVDPPTVSNAKYLNAGGGSADQFVSAATYSSPARTYAPRGRAISNVPSGIPGSVFQSNLFTRPRQGNLHFDIPTSVGEEYQVDLLFSEIFFNRSGQRIFDVAVEGAVVLDDFDIFAAAGGNSAHVETFTITGDGNLDIDLNRVRENPAISGIIVTPLGDEGDSGNPTQNSAPQLASLVDQTATVGDTVSFTASATDVDNDVLTYSIETPGLPGTPTISPQLGAFSWMPPSAGTYDVTIGVSDGQLTDSDTVRITVNAPAGTNQPPVISPIATRTVVAGNTLTFTASATDPNPGDVVSWSLDPTAPTGSSIGSTTGVFTWTPSPDQVGSQSFNVIASDGSLTDTAQVTVNVVSAPPSNSAPVLSPISDQAAFVGNTVTVTANATDANGDALTFSLNPDAPTGAAIDPSTGVFTWSPSISDVGPTEFTVFVSDGAASDSERFTVTVQGNNNPPVLSPVGTQTVAEQSLLEVQLAATDPDANDTLRYSLVTTGLAGSPTVDPNTGLFSWTPPFADGPGFEVTVRVTDSGGLSDDQTFMVVVTEVSSNNSPPVLDPINVPGATVGETFTFTVSATDLDNDPLTYFLDPSAPAGATINGNTGLFSWTPANPGTFTFPISVSDGEVAASQNVTINVTGDANGNQAPSFGPIANQSVTVNTQLQFTVPATDPENDPLTFSLAPNTLPGTPQIDQTTGVFTWVPPQISPGFEVTVVVSDSGGLSDTATFLVTVNDGPPNGNTPPSFNPTDRQTATVGQELSFTVTATDPDPGTTLEYFLDPTAPGGAAIGASTGVVTWTPEAGDVGTVTFDVFVTDGTATVADSVTVVVSNTGGGGGGGTNSPPSFGPQNNRSVAAESLLRATFTAIDDNPGDTLTYSIVTTGLPGNPTINADTGVFEWTPPASAAGNSFQITIRATDSGGLSDDAIFTVTVQGVGTGNQPPTIDAIPNQTATVGQQFSFSVNANDANGDSLVYFLDPSAPFGANISSNGVLTWTPNASDVGTVTFPIFVSDGTANTSVDITITVSQGGGGGNTAPSLAPLQNENVNEGATLTVTPIVDDPDTGDTLTFELVTQNLPGDASINASTGVFTWTPSASAGRAQAYLVTIRVTDGSGATDEGTFAVTVADTL